jgi:hypothetical protein
VGCRVGLAVGGAGRLSIEAGRVDWEDRCRVVASLARNACRESTHVMSWWREKIEQVLAARVRRSIRVRSWSKREAPGSTRGAG